MIGRSVSETTRPTVFHCLSVVGVLGGGVSLNRGSVGGVNIRLQNQLNLVDTSVKGAGAAGEVVLVGSR